MTTLSDVVDLQKSSNVLQAPAIPDTSADVQTGATATGATLSVGLYNSTTSSTVYAYVTGLALDNNSAVCLLQSDGSTAYYPVNPTGVSQPLLANCAIPLGAPGSTTNVTIPHLAGARIWFCVGNTLTFLLNQGTSGPGLVEPAVNNTADLNYNLSWDFCEFTFNTSQVYANITYVDFVCLPIALTLTTSTGTTQHVGGLPVNGLDNVCSGLIAQNTKDGAGWDKLVLTNNGTNLRALAPTNGIALDNTLFQDYWTDYVNSCWNAYISTPLVIDTQSTWGKVSGLTSNDRTEITFGTVGSITKPNATDIFGANSGAFAPQVNNTAELLNIGARMDAALNRSTLLSNANQPDGEVVTTFYTNAVTNHYSRITHAANVDGRGYTFPYDDVTGGGVDQSGFVSDPAPTNLLITVGGGNAYAKRGDIEQNFQSARSRMKRSVQWIEDVKVSPHNEMRDVEMGEHPKLLAEMSPALAPKPKISLPPFVGRFIAPYVSKLQASPFYSQRLRPLLDVINQFLVSFLSLSLRAVLSRLFLVAFFFVFYFLGLLPHEVKGQSQRRILEAAVAASNGNVNGTIVVQGTS
ncbi:Glucan endo-1,3-beta-glucosidase [Lachnellula occidentalis]|uniref:Glucan endo-1,3-beta-glucosidase n=1 Tax=Lachnellula occidentalis TaxID=215460 RepID=A0A8H8S3S2_9HELO|nr:Glucan endo-1,3-beta-glucosidase [Lachnellula occidentalis]